MNKSLICLVLLFAARTDAQDTLWIDCPRNVNRERISQNKLRVSQEAETYILEAIERINETAVQNSSRVTQVTSLRDIIDGLELSKISLTKEIKQAYIRKLNLRYTELQDSIDEATLSIKICTLLKSLRPFYISDHVMDDFWITNSQSQIDSLYKIYLIENGSPETGRYYFGDWLWLKYHHQLPESTETPIGRYSDYEETMG